jgi:predicted esterase YcpF (UPF0227 family)
MNTSKKLCITKLNQHSYYIFFILYIKFIAAPNRIAFLLEPNADLSEIRMLRLGGIEDMNIIFIHGLESDPKNSSKAQEIQDRFPEYIVSVPDYRPKERSFEEIDEFFKDYFTKIPYLQNKVLYLVGSSLGGYWALKWASQLNASGCILLNPSLTYYGEPPLRRPELPVTLLVCKDDTVVDPKFAVELFTGNATVTIFETGGHRMENTEEMLEEIEKAINNYSE